MASVATASCLNVRALGVMEAREVLALQDWVRSLDGVLRYSRGVIGSISVSKSDGQGSSLCGFANNEVS